MTKKQKRSLAFVIQHPYVDALACFREPIKYFARLGYPVDVYMRISDSHSTPRFADPRVRIIPLRMTYPGTITLMAQLATHRPRYVAIFTVPQWSLRWTMAVAKHIGTPVVYISDELIEREDEAKARERRDHQLCAFSIALSEERANALRALNHLDTEHKIYVVPNAAPGPAVRMSSRYFQEQCGIADDRCLLVHAGGMGWGPVQALIEAASRWDDSRPAVVFQGRLPTEMAGRTHTGAVWYNQSTLPSDDLDHAISSARIGLALYDDQRLNDRLMGTASGKLCLYLKNALPVITTRLDCFEWVERERLGLRVGSVDEIPDAARAIERDYETFANNIRMYYAEHLSFDERFAQVPAAL